MFRKVYHRILLPPVLKLLQLFLGKEKIKSTFLLSIANAVTRLVGFVLPFVVINFCDETIYGEFVYILNTLATIVAVFSIGITNGVSRYLAMAEPGAEEQVYAELKKRMSQLILFVVVFSVFFFVFGFLVFPELEKVRTQLLFGIIYIYFTLIGSFITGVHYVKGNYAVLSKGILVSSVLHLLFMALLTYLFGIKGTLVSYILFSIIQVWLLNEGKFKAIFDFGVYGAKNIQVPRKSESNIFVEFIIPVIVASLAPPLVMWLANNKIASSFGYKDLGFINIAMQMQVIMAFLPNIFNSMEVPSLSHAFHHQKEDYFPRLKKLALKTFFSSGLILIIVVVFAFGILNLYSELYLPYTSILRILTFSFFISVMLNVVGVVILSAASMWWGAMLNWVWGLAFLVLLSYFIPKYGLLGFAYSYLASYGLHALTVISYFVYFIKVKFLNKPLLANNL